MEWIHKVEWVHIVRALGTVLCVLGIVLCWKLRRKRFTDISTGEQVSVGVAVLSGVAFWKLAALATFAVVPVAAMGVANYHTFEGVHKVQACARCHVMLP